MTSRQAVLVTGGAGYIGSHCSKALLAAGYQPVCYDNFSTGHRSLVIGSLVEGDLQDRDKLIGAFTRHNVIAVMHLAASSLVSESMADPQKYYMNNVGGTLALLDVMRTVGCTKLVFSSTGAVYGDVDSQALPESFPCRPINPYGASKWMAEQILADHRRTYGFGAFCLRYFNAGGADSSGTIGEMRDNETHLIPRAMMALQGYVSDFAIFGGDYDTPDGTAIRDYVHVGDLAEAHVQAIRLLLAGQPGGSFNLGTGKGVSVRQILHAIAREAGRAVPHVVKERRPGDPACLVADPSAARVALNFEPRHSDLANIVKTAWAWHQKAHPLTSAKI